MEIQSQSLNTAVSVPVQGYSAGSVQTSSTVSAVSTTSSAEPAAGTVDRKQLEAAVKSIDKFINVSQPPKLAFSIDEDTDRPVVRITDASTGELIRQIPSQEALDIARSLDKMKGVLFQKHA